MFTQSLLTYEEDLPEQELELEGLPHQPVLGVRDGQAGDLVHVEHLPHPLVDDAPLGVVEDHDAEHQEHRDEGDSSPSPRTTTRRS